MSSISCRSMNDVIEFAKDREQKAQDFYLQCVDLAKQKGLKDFFREMAEEEARHLRMLQELDTSQPEAIQSESTEDLQLSDFLVDVDFKREMTYQEALIMAMKKEEKAHRFYSAWSSRCSREQTTNVFQMLAQEELKHKRKIEEIYDSDIYQQD